MKKENIHPDLYDSWLAMPVTKLVIEFVQDSLNDSVASVVDATTNDNTHEARLAAGAAAAFEDVLEHIQGLASRDPERNEEERT